MPGRNDPCPCGSGKKYKKCCLLRDETARGEHKVIPFVPPPASDRSSGPAGDVSDPEEFDPEELLKEVEKAIDDEEMVELAEAMGDCSDEDEDRIIEDHMELMDLLERGSETGEMIPEHKADELVFGLHPELLNWEDEDYERAKQDDEVDWRLHRTLDALVIRRATDPSLPDGDAIRRLKKKGITTPEAIHSVARVLANDIWHRMQLPSEKENMAAPGELPLSLEAKADALTKKTNREISRLGRR